MQVELYSGLRFAVAIPKAETPPPPRTERLGWFGNRRTLSRLPGGGTGHNSVWDDIFATPSHYADLFQRKTTITGE